MDNEDFSLNNNKELNNSTLKNALSLKETRYTCIQKTDFITKLVYRILYSTLLKATEWTTCKFCVIYEAKSFQDYNRRNNRNEHDWD